MNVTFKTGIESALPSAKSAGTIYLTNDTGRMFFDKDSENRIEIGKNSFSWNEITDKPLTFAPSSHTHNSIQDAGSGTTTTFAYSKSGMDYGDYTWLAGWNGYELRAINKSQFAIADHIHSYLPLSGGTMSGTL